MAANDKQNDKKGEHILYMIQKQNPAANLFNNMAPFTYKEEICTFHVAM